jgi:hypothetical protein
VLLNAEKESQFAFELISERCYNSEPYITNLQVEPICADDARQLVFDQFSYMMLNQNPANSEIDIVINLIKEDNVELLITDILGNIVYRQQLELAKGKHNFSIKIDNNISAAEYFISARAKQINTTQKIILIK